MEHTGEFGMDTDALVQLYRQLQFVTSLRRSGEEYEEMSLEVSRLADALTTPFVSWLRSRGIGAFEGCAPEVVHGICRFLYSEPGRRCYSPLTFGSTLQKRFLQAVEDDVRGLGEHEAFIHMYRDGLRFFLEFRATLQLVLH
jgi:hypothetical protein